jgi:hypothetical protein
MLTDPVALALIALSLWGIVSGAMALRKDAR